VHLALKNANNPKPDDKGKTVSNESTN